RVSVEKLDEMWWLGSRRTGQSETGNEPKKADDDDVRYALREQSEFGNQFRLQWCDRCFVRACGCS
ncbi:MAG TPA: hypothetical protein DGG95_03105, partial [Cytophagales bacterium]|nr:hypothetical protein [Cytophagales bacterium]